MEEYVKFKTKKALRNGKVCNWEIATNGKIKYFKDINYFKSFEIKFPAIIYEDALTSEPFEPTVSPHHVEEVDLKIEISFSESDDEDYTVICDNDLFSYKIIYVNDLKSNMDNNVDKINVKLSLENTSIKPLDSIINTHMDTYA
nr:hypothetical protein [Tanacetum cinerariifolium]